MKETDKKKTPISTRTKRSGRSDKRDSKIHKEENHRDTLKAGEPELKLSQTNTSVTVIDSNAGAEPIEVYEKMGIHYADDVNKFEEQPPQDSKACETVIKENNCQHHPAVHCVDSDNGIKPGKEGVSDCETISVSSQGDSMEVEEEKTEISTRIDEKLVKKNSLESETKKLHVNAMHITPRKSTISNGESIKSTVENSTNQSFKSMKIFPSEGVDDKLIVEVKGVDIVDEASNHSQSVTSDEETNNVDETDEHDKEALDKKIGEMETRIEKLEEELREVAALEISLYSVVPEHGSSAHKVHTPARRLSRLYIHACKHWTQDKRATIARNTVSGLVLISKSCGNDVPRLSFWLSNIVVLREIISQAFGNSSYTSPVARFSVSNGGGKRSDGKSPSMKWKGAPSNQVNKPGSMPFADDWQEMKTFTTALQKVESWIFSRIVESVWWQTVTPNMQSPAEDLHTNKSSERVWGPALGDQQQGSFSINLWKNAFQDAFKRLCPVRAEGHECGCLPVLARLVMEQCVTRLDVAMFNAILRESAHEIPTDPISDPILDSKVLPIPAGDLSFGSGAQLKNSVGNWSRMLTDLFGMDADENKKSREDDDRGGTDPKSFHLLNALSDLLMLPKDMLMDRSTRKEICPSIGLPLIKRILCNFTPDEFCPDPVPGAVLEALNVESMVERRLSGDFATSFPCPAAPVVYVPPSLADVAEKVLEVGEKSQLTREASLVQKKGYTSDEELEELDSPLVCIIDKSSQKTIANGNGMSKENTSYNNGSNSRYELLRSVWSA